MRSIFVSVRQGKLAKWQNDFLNEAMRWIFAVMIVLILGLVGSGVTISKSVPKKFFSHFYEV